MYSDGYNCECVLDEYECTARPMDRNEIDTATIASPGIWKYTPDCDFSQSTTKGKDILVFFLIGQ